MYSTSLCGAASVRKVTLTATIVLKDMMVPLYLLKWFLDI